MRHLKRRLLLESQATPGRGGPRQTVASGNYLARRLSQCGSGPGVTEPAAAVSSYG